VFGTPLNGEIKNIGKPDAIIWSLIWRSLSENNIEGEPFDNILKNISENWSPKIEF
jgi:hypothetical protein